VGDHEGFSLEDTGMLENGLMEPSTEELADTLLSEDERAEVAHIQKHFETASEEERGRLGWRATTIYLTAFQREIERLGRQASHLRAAHASSDCACGHDEFAHREATICESCRAGQPAGLRPDHPELTH